MILKSCSAAIKHIKELIDDKLQEEGLAYRVDDENAMRVAKAIIAAMKMK